MKQRFKVAEVETKSITGQPFCGPLGGFAFRRRVMKNTINTTEAEISGWYTLEDLGAAFLRDLDWEYDGLEDPAVCQNDAGTPAPSCESTSTSSSSVGR